MSRTNKDIKRAKLKRHYKNRWYVEHDKFTYTGYKYVWPDFNTSVGEIQKTIYLKKAGVKPKQSKVLDTEDHWMSTPSEWTRIMMNKPQRREGSLWEREVVKCQVSDLEEVDKPSVSRKPHVYYW